MTIDSRPPERPTAGLWLAIACSELLLALSFTRLWGDMSSAVFGSNVVDAALDHPFLGTALARHITAFVAALLLVHFVLGVTAWGLARLARLAWPASPNSQTVWALLWLLLLTIWIFAANAAWFPTSSLGSPYAGAMANAWRGVTLFQVISLGLGLLLTVTVARVVYASIRSMHLAAGWVASVATAAAAIAVFLSFGLSGHEPATVLGRPHVIVIGLDSLRPDALHTTPDGRDPTPVLNEFLSQSTVFGDTLTPLARTFPAWVSIVSGKHPHTTGAVINLLTRELIDEGDTLPRLLGKTGYRTVYATDEVRFSNLDETYGFADVVAPPMGAADFLLGFFGDTPLANLLVNTWAGRLLFPYAYANRAVAVTYDPDTFVEYLDARLSFDEPTFLAVHFTLSHWPYTWATSPLSGAGHDAPTTPELYRRSVARLDEQFGDLIRVLRAKGALENSIVVVLSDHGEALGEPLPIARDPRAMRHIPLLAAPSGHGTSVFAESQYQVLLAIRSFGASALPTQPGATLRVPATLEDLAPTLADALGITPEQPFDGLSWLEQLKGAPAGEGNRRVRFLETEFVPPGFGGEVLTTSMLQSASGYYRIDPETDRVLIRPERLDEILANRQYAATRDGQLLVSVPSDNKLQQHVVYLEQAEAAPVWATTPPTRPDDPGYELWAALQARFAPVRERAVVAPSGTIE